MVFMGGNSGCSHGKKGCLIWETHRDHVVQLAPSSHDPHGAMRRSAADCEVVGMQVSSSKPELMIECSHQAGGVQVSMSFATSFAMRICYSDRWTDGPGCCDNEDFPPLCCGTKRFIGPSTFQPSLMVMRCSLWPKQKIRFQTQALKWRPFVGQAHP